MLMIINWLDVFFTFFLSDYRLPGNLRMSSLFKKMLGRRGIVLTSLISLKPLGLALAGHVISQLRTQRTEAGGSSLDWSI